MLGVRIALTGFEGPKAQNCTYCCRASLGIRIRALAVHPGFLNSVLSRPDGVSCLFSSVRLLCVTFFLVFLLMAMLQADIVFWLGDLNYRIAETVSDAEVFEMLRNDDLETLRYVAA